MATAKKQVAHKPRARDEPGPTREFPLHMVENKKTEMYVKFAKTIVMFQGPYSEKRTQNLKQLMSNFKTASQVISDETYCKHRKTICRYQDTEEFYMYFKNQTQKALQEGNNLVILDPTLSNEPQNRHFLALAYKMQYVFLVCPPIVTDSRKRDWPPKSQANSYKDVNQFIEGSNMFQHLFCAWYLHDVDSFELRDVAKLFIDDCLTGIPEFRNIFSRVCPHIPDDEDSSDEHQDTEPVGCTIESICRHFGLDEERGDLAYCVVKIFQGMKSMNDYFKEEKVINTYGKMSKLLVAGFVVSPHMVAARIKLSRNQKELWEMPDDINEENYSHLNLPCASHLVEQLKRDLPEVNAKLISSKSNRTLVNTGQPIHEPFNVFYPNSRGRTCHIVLGKAEGAPKENVDYDVSFALKRERNAGDDADITRLEHCVVKRLGKYWLIYLKEMYSVDGFFASCCKPYSFEKAIV